MGPSLRPLILTCLVDLHAVLFGITLAFSGETMDSIVADVGACGGSGASDCAAASVLAAAPNLGALLGAIAAAPMCARLGRRAALGANALLWVASYGATFRASRVGPLLAARAVAGIAMGVASVAVPMFVAESVPARRRGALGAGFNVGVNLGIAIPAACALARRSGGVWRAVAAVATAIGGACALVAAFVIPESPAHLDARGELEAARRARKFVRGADDDESDDGACSVGEYDPECKEDPLSSSPTSVMINPVDAAPPRALATPLIAEDDAWASERDAARGRRRATGAAVLVAAAFAASGINAINAYLGEINARAGVDPYVGSFAFAVAQLAGALVATQLLCERFGRRPLLLASSAGQAVSLGALALSLAARGRLVDGGAREIASECALAAVLLFAGASAVGLAPLVWPYVAEAAPARARGQVTAAAMATFWLVSFAIAQLFAPLTALLGVAGIFAALAAVCAASCAAMSAFVLETKGLGLEEIEARFAEAAGASRGRPRRSISA